MIYLEFTSHDLHLGASSHRAVELNVETIHEAAQLFRAFEFGFIGDATHLKLELTSIGTSKRRGVEYGRWGSL